MLFTFLYIFSVILIASNKIATEPEIETYAESGTADENGFVIENGILKEYTGNATEVAIPDGVTCIEGFAFQGRSSLTSISIPASVISIGEFAFYFCENMSEIKVAVDNPSFSSQDGIMYSQDKKTLVYCPEGKRGTLYNIPDGVTSIEAGAFYDCRNLTSINLSNSLTSIDVAVFSGCSSLTSISLPDSITSIKDYAFNDCRSLTSIDLSNSLTSIGDSAFENCYELTSIKIPDSVTSIGDSAFKHCGLTIYGTAGSYAQTYAYENYINFIISTKDLAQCSVTVNPTSYTYDGTAKKPNVSVKDGSAILIKDTDYAVRYENNTNIGTAKAIITGKGNYTGTVTKTFTIAAKKEASYQSGGIQYKTIDTSAVSFMEIKDKKSTKITIPETVMIGGKTFKVTAIGNNAFKNNKKIKSVTIGDNVKTIGASAFEGCTKLGNITVGKGVTTIDKNAFQKCKNLKTLTIKSKKLKKIGKNALKGIKTTAKIKVPSTKLKTYKNLFKGKGQNKKVKITK